MWQQDDWYSCEDLTLYQSGFTLVERSRDGTNRFNHSYRVSSYPIGCMPEKSLKEVRGESKGKEGVKRISLNVLIDSIKDKRRICLKAVSQLFKLTKKTNSKETKKDMPELEEEDTLESDRELGLFQHENHHPIPTDSEASAAKFNIKHHLIPLTHAIQQRLSFQPGRIIPNKKNTHQVQRLDEIDSSDKLSSSGKSSISLPRTPDITELSIHTPPQRRSRSMRYSRDFLLPLTIIPSLETMLLACSFSSNDQTDQN